MDHNCVLPLCSCSPSFSFPFHFVCVRLMSLLVFLSAMRSTNNDFCHCNQLSNRFRHMAEKQNAFHIPPKTKKQLFIAKASD